MSTKSTVCIIVLVWFFDILTSQQVMAQENAAEIQFTGMLDYDQAVFLNLKSNKVFANVKVFYYWRNEQSSTNENYTIFEKMFTATSAINIVTLEQTSNLSYVCISLNSDFSQTICKLANELNFLDLPAPTDVSIVSVNYNYSLTWKYDYLSLTKEIGFTVEISDELDEEWIEAVGCQLKLMHHCDLFLNHFDVDDNSCPEDLIAGVISARVKPCLISRPDVCGDYVAVKDFNVKLENLISPPDFNIVEFRDNHLQIVNRPHFVAYSNKLLSCYYDDDPLHYNIQYGPGNAIEKDQISFEFAATNISLKLDHIPTNSTLVCVKMRIDSKYLSYSSSWKKLCRRGVIEGSSDRERKSDTEFYAVFISVSVLVILLLIFVFYKARRFYKSANGQIPDELEDLKKEIENDADYFSGNFVVQSFDSATKEIVDPLLSYEWPKPAFNFSKKKKRLISEETAVYGDDASSDEKNESDLSSNANDSDSLSYVCQAANGALVHMNQPLSHASVQSSSKSTISACVLEVDSTSDRQNERETVEINDTHETILANESEGSTTSNNMQSISEHVSVSHSDSLSALKADAESQFDEKCPLASSEHLSNEDNQQGAIKLENPTYNLSPDIDDFDLCKPILDSIDENGLLKYNFRPKDSAAYRHFTFDSVATNPATNSLQTDTPLGLPTAWSRNRKMTPIRLPTCLCQHRRFRSNKVDPGNFVFEKSPTLTSSGVGGQSQSSGRSVDYIESAYVTYERSRADSCRSGDSGLPHDWSLSDDSSSPPQSPDDVVFAQSKYLSKFFDLRSSLKRPPNDSRVKVFKEQKCGNRFPVELEPIVSTANKTVIDDEMMRSSTDSRCDDDYVTAQNDPDSDDYVQMSELCKM